MHHMQDVKQLTLIFMQSLNLYIKDGTGIHLNAVVLQNIFRKTYLVLVLNIHKFLLCLLIIRIYLQFVDLRKVCDPVTAHMCGYPVCKKRVPMKKETSLGDAVCLIIELLRHHLIEILQLLFLQNFCMQSCNTVYRITGCNCQMSHLYLSIIDDCHFADLILVAGIHFLYLYDKSAVDLFNDLINSGKQP